MGAKDISNGINLWLQNMLLQIMQSCVLDMGFDEEELEISTKTTDPKNTIDKELCTNQLIETGQTS